jgi:hypothetical protein
VEFRLDDFLAAPDSYNSSLLEVLDGR